MFSYLSLHGERCKTQEIASKKKRTKTHPHPPKNHGENTGKTRQGEPTNPERRNARRQGGGKTRQGEPHQPREKQKSATRRRKKKPKTRQNRLGEHLLELIQLEEARAQRPARAQVVDKKKQNNKNTTHKSCRRSVLLNLVVLKTTVVGTMHPHPGTPKQRRQETLQGRSLKGSKTR